MLKTLYGYRLCVRCLCYAREVKGKHRGFSGQCVVVSGAPVRQPQTAWALLTPCRIFPTASLRKTGSDMHFM